MENSYLQQINHYPTTLIQAYNELSNYQPDVHLMSWYPQAHDGATFNMLETLEETASVDDESLTISTFATQGQQCGGGRGSWSGCGCRGGDSTPTHNANAGHGGNSQVRNMDLSHVKCFWCHQLGHYASNCPVPYDEIVQMQAAPDSTEQSGGPDDESDHVQFRIMATTNLSIKSMVPKTWILLDTMSMVDFFPTLCWSEISGLPIICYAYFLLLELPTLITSLIFLVMEPSGSFMMVLQISYHCNK